MSRRPTKDEKRTGRSGRGRGREGKEGKVNNQRYGWSAVVTTGKKDVSRALTRCGGPGDTTLLRPRAKSEKSCDAELIKT